MPTRVKNMKLFGSFKYHVVQPITFNSITEQGRLSPAGNSTGDTFGENLAIASDGNTVISNARSSVYVFTRSGSTWSEQATIVSGVANDEFGISLDISNDGNTVVIGARYDNGAGTSRGAAYVFTRSGSTWTQEQKLTASDPVDFDAFGTKVAISGDGNTVLIGAEPNDDAGFNAGKAYIFTRSGTTWSEQQKILGEGANNSFTRSLISSKDGSTVAISATGNGVGGSVYVYTKSGSVWNLEQKFTSTDIQSGDIFGQDIDISDDGNTLIVGTPGEDTGGTQAGASYIFTRSGTTWTQQQKIQASDKSASDLFGNTLCISPNGKIVVVGAREENSGRGAAYIFTENLGTWTEKQKVVSSNANVDDEFTISLDISGDGTIAIGSWFEDVDATDAGGVYVFVE